MHGLDQSADAVAAANRNASENGLTEKCSFEAANVFDWLKSQTVARPNERVIPRFDVIVLDPPSFTRNRSAVSDALRGYKEIHLRALKLLKTGGTLVTFCCSHHVEASVFQAVILSAALTAPHCTLRRVSTFTQAPSNASLTKVKKEQKK